MRARYYNPADGRFQSRDTWGGDDNSPQTLNKWNYAESRPINYADPSGHCVRADGSVNKWGWPWGSYFKCWFDNTGQSTTTALTPTPNLPTPHAEVTHTSPTSTPLPNPPDIDYALNHWASDLSPNNDEGCTIFLSAVLQAGGLTDFSYEGTGNAYDYLFDRFNKIDFNTFDKYKYAGIVLRNNDDWENWMKLNASRIRPGDVVFYTTGGVVQQQPDHAAFIVSVGLPETTMFNHNTSGNPKPRIVEQDGLLNGADPNNPSPCPNPDLVACGSTNEAGRSIDDTPSKIFQVTIFLRGEPK